MIFESGYRLPLLLEFESRHLNKETLVFIIISRYSPYWYFNEGKPDIYIKKPVPPTLEFERWHWFYWYLIRIWKMALLVLWIFDANATWIYIWKSVPLIWKRYSIMVFEVGTLIFLFNRRYPRHWNLRGTSFIDGKCYQNRYLKVSIDIGPLDHVNLLCKQVERNSIQYIVYIMRHTCSYKFAWYYLITALSSGLNGLYGNLDTHKEVN